ncbi:Major DNA-binding protein [Dirofilaria immitis]
MPLDGPIWRPRMSFDEDLIFNTVIGKLDNLFYEFMDPLLRAFDILSSDDPYMQRDYFVCLYVIKFFIDNTKIQNLRRNF